MQRASCISTRKRQSELLCAIVNRDGVGARPVRNAGNLVLASGSGGRSDADDGAGPSYDVRLTGKLVSFNGRNAPASSTRSITRASMAAVVAIALSLANHVFPLAIVSLVSCLK